LWTTPSVETSSDVANWSARFMDLNENPTKQVLPFSCGQLGTVIHQKNVRVTVSLLPRDRAERRTCAIIWEAVMVPKIKDAL